MRTQEEAVRRSARHGALCLALATLVVAGTATAADRARPAASAPPALRLSTIDEVRACDALDDDLADRKLKLERGIARHQRDLARLQQENEQLSAMAAVIDRTSEEAIGTYNTRVDALNREQATLNDDGAALTREQDDFNGAVFARNKRCATLVLSARDSEIHRRDIAAREHARAAAAAGSAASAQAPARTPASR